MVFTWFLYRGVIWQRHMMPFVMRASWSLALGFLGIVAVMLAYSRYTTEQHKNKFKKDQQQLKILFETKLGMWSPK